MWRYAPRSGPFPSNKQLQMYPVVSILLHRFLATCRLRMNELGVRFWTAYYIDNVLNRPKAAVGMTDFARNILSIFNTEYICIYIFTYGDHIWSWLTDVRFSFGPQYFQSGSRSASSNCIFKLNALMRTKDIQCNLFIIASIFEGSGIYYGNMNFIRNESVYLPDTFSATHQKFDIFRGLLVHLTRLTSMCQLLSFSCVLFFLTFIVMMRSPKTFCLELSVEIDECSHTQTDDCDDQNENGSRLGVT